MFKLSADFRELAAASTSFAGVPTLPQAGLPSCPPTWMDLVQPICPTLDVKYALERCVFAQTPQMKQQAIALIMKIMESGPTVANYITFVLAYLEDFKISILPRAQMKDSIEKSYYRPVERLIEIFAEDVDLRNPYIITLIRHELRHAYWHTLNQVSLYKELTFSSDNVYPPTVEMKKKVLGYIQAGNQRIENLTELLRKEQRGRLTLKEQSELHRLRRVCDIDYDRYPSLNYQQDWPLGETYEIELIGLRTQMKILAHVQGSSGFFASLVSFVDPLIFVIKNVVELNNILSKSPVYQDEKKYTREFDAHLYQFLPEQIIKEFYSELDGYNRGLERQIMHSPSLQAMSYRLSPLLSQKEYESIKFDRMVSDNEYFRALLREKGNDYLILQIAEGSPSIRRGIANGKVLDGKATSALQIYKSVLNSHIKNGVLVPEAHRLLGRFHYILKADPKTICMHYRRAFKKIGEVEFDLYDYFDYIDSLLLINNTGEAKIVVQKARAKFLSNPELDERWAKIKTLQANSNSQPPGKPKVI